MEIWTRLLYLMILTFFFCVFCLLIEGFGYVKPLMQTILLKVRFFSFNLHHKPVPHFSCLCLRVIVVLHHRLSRKPDLDKLVDKQKICFSSTEWTQSILLLLLFLFIFNGFSFEYMTYQSECGHRKIRWFVTIKYFKIFHAVNELDYMRSSMRLSLVG